MLGKHYKIFIVGSIFLVALFSIITLANAKGNIHIGALEVHPFASIKQRYDDNIFLEPNNEENDDWITTATLGVTLQMPIVAQRQEDFMFKAKYAADIIEFWDNTNQSRIDHTISALADFTFANDSTLKVEEDFKKTADPPNSELTDLEKRIRNTIQVVLGYIREEISFDLGYKNIRDDYKKLSNLDRYEHIVTATGYYRIFPKTSILSECNFGTITYDDSTTNSDSDYYQIRLGLKGEIATKLTGVIKGGYKYTTYDDSSKEDFRGVTIFTNLIYSLQERSTLNIYSERSSIESTYRTNSYFESNKIGLKFDHQLLERLFLVTGGYYQLNKYPEETSEGSETAKRKDYIWDGSIGLRYEIKDRAVIEASYEYKQRDSKFATFDYEDNKVTTKISFLF
jgi:hypothetical protein